MFQHTHSQKRAPAELSEEDVKRLVELQIQQKQPIRPPWYREKPRAKVKHHKGGHAATMHTTVSNVHTSASNSCQEHHKNSLYAYSSSHHHQHHPQQHGGGHVTGSSKKHMHASGKHSKTAARRSNSSTARGDGGAGGGITPPTVDSGQHIVHKGEGKSGTGVFCPAVADVR